MENNDGKGLKNQGILNNFQELINNTASQLIGMEISEAGQRLGYWWVLENQHVKSSGSKYDFSRAGVGKVTLYTNEKNTVVKTSLCDYWGDKRKKKIKADKKELHMYELGAMKTVLGDDYDFRRTKTVDEVKRILETGEMEGSDTTPFVLVAGNLDIEMNIDNFGMGVITESGIEIEPLSLSYFCCIRKNGEWESYEEIPYPVNLDVPDLEAEMFRVLDRFAEKRALSFFAENDHISGHSPRIEQLFDDENEGEDEMEI